MPGYFYSSTHHFPLLLSAEELAEPKLILSTLFGVYDLPVAHRLLAGWYKCAFSDRSLARNKILDVLALQHQLMLLLEAASLLPDRGKSTLDPRGPDLMDPAHYFTRERASQQLFDYFPRSLNRKEYINPYLVLEKGRRRYTLPDWRGWLEDLWSAATGRSTLYELSSGPDAWIYCRLLSKHLDAAHLIYIRECQ